MLKLLSFVHWNTNKKRYFFSKLSVERIKNAILCQVMNRSGSGITVYSAKENGNGGHQEAETWHFQELSSIS
jgi:hypothetical protein